MNRKIIMSAALLFSVSAVWAGGGSTTSGEFLKLGVNARAVSLGEAYSAVADDATAVYWNPAGLTSLHGRSLDFTYGQYLESSSLNQGAYGQSLGKNMALGVGFRYFSNGDIEVFDGQGQKTGSLTPQDTAVSVGLAYKLKNLSIGVGTKYIQSELIDKASTLSFDLGGTYQINSRLRVGVSLLNMMGELKYESEGEDLPQSARVGGVYHIQKEWLVSADVVQEKGEDSWAAVGTEYQQKIGKIQAAFRAGYNTRSASDVEGFSGVSFGVGVQWQNYGIDYAAQPFGDLGMTNRVSLSYQF